MDASDGTTPVYIALLPEDDILYKGVGKTFSAYRRYSAVVSGAEDIERDKEGLSYTLKGVTTYSTLSDQPMIQGWSLSTRVIAASSGMGRH